MRQGARTDLQPSANLPVVSQPEAATLLNVSERSVQHARTVLDNGTLKLVTAVERGEPAVSAPASTASSHARDAMGGHRRWAPPADGAANDFGGIYGGIQPRRCSTNKATMRVSRACSIEALPSALPLTAEPFAKRHLSGESRFRYSGPSCPDRPGEPTTASPIIIRNQSARLRRLAAACQWKSQRPPILSPHARKISTLVSRHLRRLRSCAPTSNQPPGFW